MLKKIIDWFFDNIGDISKSPPPPPLKKVIKWLRAICVIILFTVVLALLLLILYNIIRLFGYPVDFVFQYL